MIRANMSLLLSTAFAAVLVFIPARYSNADSVKTEIDTYSSSRSVPPPVSGYRCDYRASQQTAVPGVDEKRSIQTCSRSDMDSSMAERQYKYKREQSQSHLGTLPGTQENKTEVETYRRSDVDPAPPVEREYQYQHRVERY